MRKLETKNELKITVVNAVVSIAFLIISYIHTLRIVEGRGFVEGNPIARMMINANPLFALFIGPLLAVLLVYVSWRVHRYVAMCVSSVLVGFTAFDLWTHIYLII